MNAAYTIAPEQGDAFAPAQAQLDKMANHLQTDAAMRAGHSALERYIETEGRELNRLLMQAHLDLRSERERPTTVRDSDGIARTRHRRRARVLKGMFGAVGVTRLAYEQDDAEALHPLEGGLNLPQEMYSFGLHWLVAEACAQSSFEQTAERVQQRTGVTIGKRQLEQLAVRAAQDFEKFYACRELVPENSDALLVLTFDAKGIIVREEDLRPETRKAAQRSRRKLATRLTSGEKKNRKRMAQVAAVYSVSPYQRRPEDLLPDLNPVGNAKSRRPRPSNKRVWTSLERDSGQVIREAFDEALKRDPHRRRRWVVLVDGNRDQLDSIRKVARKLGVRITIVLDLVHVTEYLWRAAHAFHPASSEEAEEWVHQRVLGLLSGQSAGYIARGMRRLAEARNLDAAARKPVHECARYLVNNTRIIKYAEALKSGLPIGTGVVEGACRYLINDRMRRARWSLAGAEAVLKLRALWASGDLNKYWEFHLTREHQRNHESRYANERVPDAIPASRPRLRRVK